MRVSEFLSIRDEDEILKVKAIKSGLKGRNYIGRYKSKSFMDFSFSKLGDIRKYYSEGNILYLVSATCNIGHRELLKSNYTDLLYYLKFVDDELEKIANAEKILNQKDEEEMLEADKMEMSGVADLNVFEELNIIDNLANGDLLKWKEIERQPYKNIWTMLYKKKISERVRRKYNALNKKPM